MQRREFVRALGGAAVPLVAPAWACRVAGGAMEGETSRGEAASAGRAPASGPRSGEAPAPGAPGRGGAAGRASGDQGFEKLRKPKEEWKEILDPAEYRILFEEGTEPAGSSPLLEEKREGTYVCAACFLPLFDSETKFESGTGWPSFYRPLRGRVETKEDFKLVFPRTEYHCARCDGHQGHVFDDGPPPTGERWCNNGLALDFVPAGEPLPDLRT